MQRARIADESWGELKDRVDALITIPNDRLLNLISKETSLLSAFSICDDVLRQAVQGISDLIIMPGVINVDFADVKAVMQNAGSALMGVGMGTGDDRAVVAAKAAVSSPLLDIAMDGARGVLFNIAGGPDLTMWEINEAAKIITESIDRDAKIIFGAVHDEKLKKGEIKITVIATGFGNGSRGSAYQDKESGKKYAPSVNGQKNETENIEESEWEAVPAFLRRKK